MAVDVDYALDADMPLIAPRNAAVLALLCSDDKRGDVAFVGLMAKTIMLQLYEIVPPEQYDGLGELKRHSYDEEASDAEGTRYPPAPLWSPSPDTFFRLPRPREERLGSVALVVACILYDERDKFEFACKSCLDVGLARPAFQRFSAPVTSILLALTTSSSSRN